MRGIGFGFLAASLLWLPVEVAAQDCVVCDTEIVMTRDLAECFLRHSEATIAEMRSQNLPYALVNLGLCDGVGANTRGAYGEVIIDASRLIFSWAQIKGATQTTPLEPTTTFILDEAAILCLDATIRSNKDRFDPAGAFRPTEMCR